MAKRFYKLLGAGLALLLLLLTVCAVPAFGVTVKDDRPGGKGVLTAAGGSDRYALAVDTETLAVTVTDKATGAVVLKSDNVPPDTEETDNGLNNTWERFAESAVTVYYTNEKLYQPLTDFTDKEIELETFDDGFDAKIRIFDIGLRFTLKVRLKSDALEASVPYSSIVETKADRSPLLSIVVYPFMNATRGVTDGFLLVPDGSGAVIDLTKRTLARNPYAGRVYGDDLGVAGKTALKKYGSKPPYKVTYPVFGAVSAGTGYLARVTKGAEYSEIRAYAAGVTTDYNFAYNTFIYREGYYLPVDNKGTVVSRIQTDKNRFDAVVRYTILRGGDASLSGMAAAYRDQLEQEGTLRERLSGGDIPAKIDFLMADSYPATFGRKVVPMTDADFARETLAYFHDSGVTETVTALSGFTKGGKTGSSPAHFGFESKTGSVGDYRALTAYARDRGVQVMPMVDYVAVNNDAYIDNAGVNYKQKDIAMSMGKEFVTTIDTASETKEYDDYYMLHPEATARYYGSERGLIGEHGFTGIQMNTVGNHLSSSVENGAVTRTGAIEAYRAMLSDAGTLALDDPAEYLWQFADQAVNMPMGGSQFIIALDAVPFVQMVLSGHIDMFRDYINLRSDAGDVLSMVEYNVSPAWLLTENDPYDLFLTNSFYVFSSMASDWRDDAVETYKKVNDALKHVRGALYLQHETAAPGVKRCVYSNGVKIYVNHNDAPVTVDGVTVGAASYKVVQ